MTCVRRAPLCLSARVLLLVGRRFLGRSLGCLAFAFGGFGRLGLEQRGGLVGRTLRGFRRFNLSTLGLRDQPAALGEEFGLVGRTGNQQNCLAGTAPDRYAVSVVQG